MSHATNRIQVTTPNEVRSGPQVIRCKGPAAAVAAANDPAQRAAGYARPIDPMLLVHQERVETFRKILAAVKRSYRALTGRSPLVQAGPAETTDSAERPAAVVVSCAAHHADRPNSPDSSNGSGIAPLLIATMGIARRGLQS